MGINAVDLSEHRGSAHESLLLGFCCVASLSQAFARVPNELGLSPEVRFRVVVQGRQRELQASVWNDIYRIGREAILNAYRHSRSKSIELQIEFRQAQLRLSVRDNGCGINPQEVQPGRCERWGLQGMRDRADHIGARLRVLSRIAAGTEIELCVPGGIAFAGSGAIAA